MNIHPLQLKKCELELGEVKSMEPVDINPEIAITKTGTLQNWVHHPSECKCILVNFQISTCAADICKWANLVIGYRGIQEG